MKDTPVPNTWNTYFWEQDGGACLFSFERSVFLSCFAISAENLLII